MTSSRSRHRRDWDDLGHLDPLWAILAHPGKRHGGWRREEFFRTGETEIGSLVAEATALGHPEAYETSLDFGCGVGRVTRALSKHFRLSIGVDISRSMLRLARAYSRDVANCRFLACADNLGLFADDAFDFIYSNLVLQHLSTTTAMTTYLIDFLRVLKPGGLLAFQLPSFIPLWGRIQPRRRLYRVLRDLGCRRGLLYRLGLYPLSMRSLSQEDVIATLATGSGRVLMIRDQSSAQFRDQFYYVTKAATAHPS